MRRFCHSIFTTYCLLFLWALLPTGMTVRAQNTGGDSDLTLHELYSACRGGVIDCRIDGDIPIPLTNETDLKKYFGEIIAVKYLDGRTARLHTQGFMSPNIRIEVNKGRLRLKHVYPKSAAGASVQRHVTMDGAQNPPICVVGLTVDSLDKSDKDLIVRVYLNKSNEIIGEKNYRLNLERIDLDADLQFHEVFSECSGKVTDYRVKYIPIPLSDKVDLKKYFEEILAVKYVDARTVRIYKGPKKPNLRIEVDKGRLKLRKGRIAKELTRWLEVDSLDKRDECLTVSLYWDESNEKLVEQSYRLNLAEPIILKTASFLAVHYYDTQGNWKQYRGGRNEWVSNADWDRPVTVVAVDDCGSIYKIDSFEITTPNSFDGYHVMVKGDTMPSDFAERMKNAKPGRSFNALILGSPTKVKLNDGEMHDLYPIDLRFYKD